MEKLTEVLAMNGYAVYIWPSFVITAITMWGMVFVSVRSLKRAQKTLIDLQKAMPLPPVADL